MIQATTAGEVTDIRFTVCSDGTVSFDTPMVRGRTEVSYDRKKGPKVLTRVPSSSQTQSFNPNDELRPYDAMIAVDTNTKPVQGRTVSVVGIVLGMPVGDPTGARKGVHYYSPFCIEFTPACPKPERLGWYLAMRFLQRDREWMPGPRTALIVDSELDRLDAYNRREEDPFPGFRLPPNVQLVYASSDVGKEYIGNLLIRTADRVSSQVLAEFESGRVALADIDPEYASFPYRSLRTVHTKSP